MNRAELVKLGRAVAIKFLRPAFARQPDFVKRFEREALAMSRVYHHHAVSIIDFGVHEGSPYLVMEYVPGRSLSHILRDGPLPAARAVRIALQVLDTLEYFHRRNLLHRDLKAENIMIAGEDEDERDDFVMVLDFGMAKLLAGVGADISVSAKGIIVGTPSAMSPEQIRELPLDGRSDLYSMGVMLYHMLTGKRPFSGDDMVAVFKMHLEKPPAPPTEIVGTRAISRELEAAVLKSLEKDREQRYPDAAAMAAALAATPEASERGRRASTVGSVRLPSAGSRSWLAYAGWPIAGILGLALAVQLVRGESRPVAPPPDTAVSTATPVDAAPVVDAAPLPPPPDAAPAPDAAPTPPAAADWQAELDDVRARVARGDHRGALRAAGVLVRAHPDARSDADVIDAAIASLAAPYGDQLIDALLRDFGKDTPVIDGLARAMTGGDAWYTRHHAWLALRRAGHADLADNVALWIADIERSTVCSELRHAHASLRGSRDARATALVAALADPGDTSYERQRACLAPR